MGLGVLKRKPDIKWQKEEKDIQEITDVQENILKTCIRYLRIGGELVYSTCSILKEENEDIINKIIDLKSVQENGKIINEILDYKNVGKKGKVKVFKVLKQKNILPDINTDGFFICKIKRIM